MSRICVYCGKAGSSKEHVWPGWVRRHATEVLGVSPKNVQRYEGSQEHRGALPRQTSVTKGHSRLTLTIKHPCKTCNNGWMSRLEETAAPILKPMIEGRQLELVSSDVKIVRAWATKTALNFVYASEHAYTLPIKPELAHQLFAGRNNQWPLPNVQVWTAAYEPLGQFAYRHMTARGYGLHPITGLNHQVLRVVFVAGDAVFYVRLPDSEDGQGLGWRDPLPQFTPLPDPPSDQVIPWRKGALDDSGISETFNRHIHGGIYSGQDVDVWRGLE